MKKNLLRLAIAGAVTAGALFSAAPAQAAPHEYAPCAKLSAGETKFSAHGANRVVFTTAQDYGISQVLITGCVKSGGGYVQEWQTTGYGGLKGFAPPGKMWEDTYYSPTGSYSTTEALGRFDPGTALKYYTVNPNSRWGGERGVTYNQYFEGAGGPSDENLYTYMNQGYYEQAAVINWNRQPDMAVTQGASFAIFFHAGNVPSAGCISTDLGTVTKMLRTATPGDRFIMGTVNDVFKPAAPKVVAPPAPAPAPAAPAQKAVPAAPVTPLPEFTAEPINPVIITPSAAPTPTATPSTAKPTPTPAPTPSASSSSTPSPIGVSASADPTPVDSQPVSSADSTPLYIGGGALILLLLGALYFLNKRRNPSAEKPE
jgi:L,D-peptidoglycan transpeptidase YkuD (ErfK/YbiS/YcfS/YnhG family)